MNFERTLRVIQAALQYQYIGQMNFDQYLYSFIHSGGESRRSGDASNGYRNSNSAPIVAPYTGKITKAIFRIRGIAQSTGSAAANMTFRSELWRVGATGSEGTKIGDVNITFATAGLTIGTFWNSSIVTNFTGSSDLDLAITEGDLLGLKFIRTEGNSNVVAVENTTITLILEEN